MAKFCVQVAVHTIDHVTCAVEAANAEEACELVKLGKGEEILRNDSAGSGFSLFKEP